MVLKTGWDVGAARAGAGRWVRIGCASLLITGLIGGVVPPAAAVVDVDESDQLSKGAGEAGRPTVNHYIVLFDGSGSVRLEHTERNDFWGGKLGNSAAMAERIERFVKKVFDEMPEEFTRFQSGRDIYSFILFNTDFKHPSYLPERMFFTNRDLLAARRGLPTAEDYESLDRGGPGGETIALKDVFDGHSPLIAATAASLPFLANAIRAAGEPRGTGGPLIGHTYIIRITDGQYNTESNGNDEHAVIQRRAAEKRGKGVAAQDDGIKVHQALTEAVNRVFEIGARRVDCAFPTNARADTFGIPLDCTPESFRKITKWGDGFLISYLSVEPKGLALAGLAHTDKFSLELDNRYRDGAIHHTGHNDIVAAAARASNGLYELMPVAADWMQAGGSWNPCQAPDTKTGRVNCGPAGPVIDFEEGAVPKELDYRVHYEMRFLDGGAETLLYPYSLALEPLDLRAVPLHIAPIDDKIYDLPREPGKSLIGALNPRRYFDPSAPEFPERSIDPGILKNKAVSWKGAITARMPQWRTDRELTDESVYPWMIARVSSEKRDLIKDEESTLNARASGFYNLTGLGIAALGLLLYLLWPRRTFFAEIKDLENDEIVLDFNDRGHERTVLIGAVRVENLRRNATYQAGFPNLAAVLRRLDPIGSDGGDAAAWRFAERANAPFALANRAETEFEERHTPAGRQVPIYFDSRELRDLHQDAGAVDAAFELPACIAVAPRGSERMELRFGVRVRVLPERGNLGVQCTGGVPLQPQPDRQVPATREVEFQRDQRSFSLCTYDLCNTARHRYSLAVQGALSIEVIRANGTVVPGAVRLVVGDRDETPLEYNLRYGETMPVVLALDFSRFSNPVAAEDYRVLIRHHDGPLPAHQGQPPTADSLDEDGAWETLGEGLGEWILRLARSTERTDCSAIVLESEQHRSEPVNKARPALPAPFPVGSAEHPRLAMPQVEEAQNGFPLCTVRLNNACRSGHGDADWTIRVGLEESDAITIPEDALKLIDDRGSAVSRGTLRDSAVEREREQDLTATLDLGRVIFLKRDVRLTIGIEVDWSVREDGPLNPGHVQRFGNRLRVVCHLRHEPPRHVLAIDFGTSALAVAHAVGPGAVTLLRLPLRLAEFEAEQTRQGTPSDRTRDDADRARDRYFLASEFNVLWDDARLRQTEPDDPQFLELPRNVNALYEHADKCFTSLKALISAGFRVLPLDARAHPYQLDGRLVERAPPPLDRVIAGAYRGLLANFIEPILKAKGQYGYSHICITHPNTYTPNHVRELRRIIEGVFRGVAHGPSRNVVYPENIHFFSESDAVAYYYLIHAHRLRAEGFVVPKRERILVYDIGAGTLDLTYLEVDWEPNEAQGFTPTRIRVRRRGGVLVAGDLLDECIARDLHAALVTLDPKLYLSPIVVAEPGQTMDEPTLRRMEALRQQIHVLKTSVSQGPEEPSLELTSTAMNAGQLVWTGGDETPSRYKGRGDLRATPRGQVFWEPGRERLLGGDYVSAFIEQVTRIEVEHFFGEDRPRLDTVIVSGRTSLWPNFQDRLRASLGEVANWVDFGREADALKQVQAETLKQVVVMGVIEREFRWRTVEFESPPVNGRFGVRYERAHAGDWHFEPYETPGEQKTFYLHDAGEVQIGLLTNNGFHRCYNFVPDLYYGDDMKLTIRLDFNETGYLKADVSNMRGEHTQFQEITSIATLEFTRWPWPLGAAKLHAQTPQELMQSRHLGVQS